MTLRVHIGYTEVQNPRGRNTIMRMRFPQENGRLYVACIWLSKEEVLDLRNGAVSENPHKFFGLRCPLSA